MSQRPGLLALPVDRDTAVFVWHNVPQCALCNYRVYVRLGLDEHDGVCGLADAARVIVAAYDRSLGCGDGDGEDRFEAALESHNLITLPNPGTNFIQKVILG